MKIAVVGAGWYGCHIALALRKAGHDVTLFEKEDDIFYGVSGMFGVRLHVGPHYTRSKNTRISCLKGYHEFKKQYPELVVEHVYSIYGLGTTDANNDPPKVNADAFQTVLKEVGNSREINPTLWGYDNLQKAFDVEEPSIVVGDLLREKFRIHLQEAGIKILCKFNVKELKKENDGIQVIGEKDASPFNEIFDYVVNTTSYQSLLPPPNLTLPSDLDIVYQPCLALVYEDRLSKANSLPPFSFIVMDGSFPCIMPYIEKEEDLKTQGNSNRKYILTHGSYTIMGSYKTTQEAKECLEKVDDSFVNEHVRPKCEFEMKRFWPEFSACVPTTTNTRFNYVGWKGAVLAKLRTNREFRSAVTFADPNNKIVYVIPGKVSNIFDAAHETLSLINNRDVLQKGSYQIVENGSLYNADNEIREPISDPERNTCNLQTYKNIVSSSLSDDKAVPPIQQYRRSSSSSVIPNVTLFQLHKMPRPSIEIEQNQAGAKLGNG